MTKEEKMEQIKLSFENLSQLFEVLGIKIDNISSILSFLFLASPKVVSALERLQKRHTFLDLLFHTI